jgi:hypothetical protein
MAGELEMNSMVREVIKRAVVDHDFRQLAVRDSEAAIAEVSGKKLPQGISIQFVDNYKKRIKTIALPDPVENPQELTDEELEQVAGGGGCSCGDTVGKLKV